MKNEKNKIKPKTNHRRVKKTTQRRTNRTHPTSKRKSQLQSEIRSYFEKEFEKRIRADETRARSKNRKNENNTSKKTKTARRAKISQPVVERKRSVINSYKYSTQLVREILTTNLRPRDQWDLFLDINQDETEIYEMLVPYVHKLLKKIRKPREIFSLHLGYKDDTGIVFVSSEYKEFRPTPKSQEEALYYLIEMILKEIRKYQLIVSEFKLKKLQLRFYNAVSNTRTNRPKKTKARKKLRNSRHRNEKMD